MMLSKLSDVGFGNCAILRRFLSNIKRNNNLNNRHQKKLKSKIGSKTINKYI